MADRPFQHPPAFASSVTCLAALLLTGIASGDEVRQFQVLMPFLSSEGGESAYAEAASKLNSSGKTIAVAAHRLRRRFRYLVRSAIADTVSTPDEVEEEYRSLFL